MLDSGCTNHMTGEEDMFHSLQLTQEAQEIVFGDSGKSKVIGIGKIPISDQQSLSNVLLVDSLSYNLLSVSQLCGMGYNCLFSDVDVKILRREDSSVAFTGRLKGKIYLVDFTQQLSREQNECPTQRAWFFRDAQDSGTCRRPRRCRSTRLTPWTPGAAARQEDDEANNILPRRWPHPCTQPPRST